MKAFIVGVAICILLVMFLLFIQCYHELKIQQINLKYCTDECSSTAVLYYYDNYESNHLDGKKIFKEHEGLKGIKATINCYLNVNNDLNFVDNKIFKDKVHYKVYFFNGNGECNVYQDGIRERSFNFVFPYLYKDELLKYYKCISEPNVVVTIDIGKYYSNFFTTEYDIIMSSGYEYVN